MILPREVVVGGEMDQIIGAAGLTDEAEGGRHRRGIRDIRLKPADVGMWWDAAANLRPPRQADDVEVVLEPGKEALANKARGAGDHQSRQ